MMEGVEEWNEVEQEEKEKKNVWEEMKQEGQKEEVEGEEDGVRSEGK